MKKCALVILFAGGIIATALLVMDSRPLAKLRRENQELNAQLDQSLKLEEKHRRRSNQGGQAGNKSALPEEQFRELLRLRGEVGYSVGKSRRAADPAWRVTRRPESPRPKGPARLPRPTRTICQRNPGHS